MSRLSNSDELLAEYEYLRQEVGLIDGQIRELQDHHSSLVGARETVNGLKVKKDSELLIPAGSGFYFNASLASADSFVVNVGAGVLIEMSLDKAEKVLNERIEQALSMVVKLNEDAESMIGRMRQIEDNLSQQQ